MAELIRLEFAGIHECNRQPLVERVLQLTGSTARLIFEKEWEDDFSVVNIATFLRGLNPAQNTCFPPVYCLLTESALFSMQPRGNMQMLCLSISCVSVNPMHASIAGGRV